MEMQQSFDEGENFNVILKIFFLSDFEQKVQPTLPMLEICVEYKNDEETFNFYIKQVGKRKIVLYFGWLDF